MKDRMPNSIDTCTISEVANSKVSALLFDKLWVPTQPEEHTNENLIEIPEEVTFGNGIIEYEGYVMMAKENSGIPLNVDEVVPLIKRYVIESFAKKNILVSAHPRV